MTYYPTQPMQSYPPGPPATRRVHGLALSSGIVAGVALLSSFTHLTSFLTWIPAIVAIVLAIVALVKRATPRWLPITALCTAALAWLIAIVVAFSGIAILAASSQEPDPQPVAVAVSTPQASAPTEATAEPTATPTPEPEAVAPPSPPVTDDGSAPIGATLTNEDGVAMTVTSVVCGIPYVGNEYFGESAIGQFCEVRLAVANGGADPVDLTPFDFTGVIGGAEYEASYESTFGGQSYSTTLNPGLSTEAVVYFDMPVGATIGQITYVPGWGILTTEMRFQTV